MLVDESTLLRELEPTVARLIDRHYGAAKEWFPHDLVPWGRGRDFEPGYVWEPNETVVDSAVRSALFVNLLTEDNLPYYSMEIHAMFGADGPWGEWARRWTAEEGRHSIVMRDWMTVTCAIDPVALERGRMAQVSGGTAPHPTSSLEGLAYVTLQELATRISHFNTGKLIDDDHGKAIMRRVGADENLHYLFYKDITSAALEVDPSAGVIGIWGAVDNFDMPGLGIPDFKTHAAAIAKAGIYNFSIHHAQILVPVVLRDWKVDKLEGLSPEAEQARTKLLRYIERVAKVAKRQQERQEELTASVT